MEGATDNGVALGPAVLTGIFIGLAVIIFTYFAKWIRQEKSAEGSAKNDQPDRAKSASSDASGKHGKKEQTGAVKQSSKKKLTERENRRSARANDKGFSHPWLLATLKGHSGRVLDMDFSANGKYLASCGDEDPDPGGLSSTTTDSSSSSESNKENSLPPSQSPSPIMHKGLSRRQRKNRKRDHTNTVVVSKNEPEVEVKELTEQKELSGNGKAQKKGTKGVLKHHQVAMLNHGAKHHQHHHRQGERGRKELELEPLEEYRKLRISEEAFANLLTSKYSLKQESMAILGYPVRPAKRPHLDRNYQMMLVQNQSMYYSYIIMGEATKHHLDVHAEEFVPKSESGDSGNGSEGSGSSSEEDSSSGSEGSDDMSSIILPKLAPGTINRKDVHQHICVRCGSFFFTTSKKYLTREPCSYHWGKLRTLNHGYGPMEYTCCKGAGDSVGCAVGKLHVWNGPVESNDRTVFIWEAKDLQNKDRKSLRVNVEFDYATHVKWSPDSKAFVIHRFNENCLEVYKVDKKKDGWLTAAKAHTFPKGHETDVIGMGIASNGKFIMTCSNKTDMVIWDLKGETLAKIETFLMNTTCAKISPCGRFVVASGFTPEAKTWEVSFDKSGDFKEIKQVPQLTLGGHSSGVYDVAFDVDSSHMATVSKDGTWRLFDTKVNYKQGQDARLDRSEKYDLAGSNALIALSPNSQVVAIATATDLQFFSTLTGELDYTIENVSNERIAALLFDASGKYLFVASDKQIRVFHNVTGYRCNIFHAKEKLKEQQTSATKERLQQLINDSEDFLKNIGEN